MAGKGRPYEQFGPFILFKRLESDALGDLWRAARLDGSKLGPVIALRRLSGGNRQALVEAASEAKAIVPMLSGTSFVRSQSIEIVDGIPALAHDYAGGRSLRHIVDRARGGTNAAANPIPLDQAIVIAEKVALSLATTNDLRYGDKRLTHGALLPQFIWISDDGETRVAGQQLGQGIVASLKDTRVAAECGRYIAPEVQSSGQSSKASEVYSLGAILFLVVTGSEPPEPLTGSAFAQTIRAAKLMSGADIPADIRAILDKSLALDPAARYASVADMKQALSALTNSGRYSATTFNLAFYLSNLLKKEMESEALDRERESKVNVAAYAEQPATPAGQSVAPTFAAFDQPKKKNMVPLYAIAAAVVVAGGIGVAMMMRGGAKAAPAKAPLAAVQPAPAPKPLMISQPIVAATTATAPATATADPEAQKKAFEAAVNQKLQEEMMKLQKDYTQSLKQQQSKNAPVATQAAVVQQPSPQTTRTQTQPQHVAEDRAVSAAALDERRLSEQHAPAQQPIVTTSAPAQQQQTVPVQQPVAAPAIREGDVVDVTDLDALPNPLRPIQVHYPPMALRAKVQATIILSTLIDENGNVLEVKVLRGDPRFGFNEEAVRAVRATRFSSPMKGGKRVKTWRPQTIQFQL